MTPLAASLAYLGSLAFVAWCLWLRRTDERRTMTAEMARAAADARAQRDELAAELERMGKRVLKLEQRATGFGGRE